MIIECALCNQKNNVELKPTKARICCGRCGAPLNLPSYVKETDAKTLSYVTGLKNLFLRTNPKRENKEKNSVNKDKTEGSFLYRMGNVLYGASVIASMAWSIFVSNTVQLFNEKTELFSALETTILFTIIGWIVIFGIGWAARYLFSGVNKVGWKIEILDVIFQKLNLPSIGLNMASIAIMAIFIILPSTSFIHKYYTTIRKSPMTAMDEEKDNMNVFDSHSEKTKTISPKELELTDIRGNFVEDRHSEITLVEEFGTLNSNRHHGSDIEPRYFKITGSVKNNSSEGKLFINLNVRIFMCDEINNDNCIVVGDQTDAHRISVPSDQMRSFRSVVAFYDLPKLNKWRWDYRLTKVEAVSD